MSDLENKNQKLSKEDLKFLLNQGIKYLEQNCNCRNFSFNDVFSHWSKMPISNSYKYALSMVLLTMLDKMQKENKITKDIQTKLGNAIMKEM